jgi:membrane protein
MLERAPSWQSRFTGQVEAYFMGGPLRRKLYKVALGMRRDRVGRAASAMAFNLFLAAIPMLALAGWLFANLLQNSPYAMASTSLLLDLTPEEARDLIEKHFQRFSAQTVAPFALLGSLWLGSSAFHTCMTVFEGAVRATRRPWWQKRAIALGCVFVAIFAFALSGYLTVVIAGGPEALLRFFGREAKLLRWVAALVGLGTVTALLAGFFRIAVHLPGVKRRVWPGAFAAVAIGGAASWCFARFAQALMRFALFYGSLAAVAILLAWLWLWCAAMLVGAELNAQLEGAPLRDSLVDS